MSQSDKSLGNYLLYTLMAVGILLTIAATVGVYRNVVNTLNTTLLIAAIAAIGSCASAVASLYVANRTQKLSEKQRETEREEANARTRHNRERIAAHYAAEIRAWLRRRDLQQFLSDLGGLKTKPEILGTIEVSLVARQSNRKVAGADISADHDLQDTIAWQARKSAELLVLSSFAKFRRIPSIWTVLFQREDTELLVVGAMAFFISMKSVWINLTLATEQIPSVEEVVKFVNGEKPEYAGKYLGKLIDQVFELRDLFTLFSTTVKKCADWLERKKGEDDPLANLSVPERLENGSRDAAFDWTDISREIQLDESLEMRRSARKGSLDFSAEVKRNQQGLEKYQEMVKGVAEEQRRLLKDQGDDSTEDHPK